jgi:hypothetical protein
MIELKTESAMPTVAARRGIDLGHSLTIKSSGSGSLTNLNSPTVKARFQTLKNKTLFKKLQKEEEGGGSKRGSVVGMAPGASLSDKPFVEAKGSMMGTAQKAAQLMEKKSGKPRMGGLGIPPSAELSANDNSLSLNSPYSDSSDDISQTSQTTSLKPSNMNYVTSFTSDDSTSIPISVTSRVSGSRHEREPSRNDMNDDVASILEAANLSDEVEGTEQEELDVQETQDALNLFLQTFGPGRGYKWQPTAGMLGTATLPVPEAASVSPASSLSGSPQIPYFSKFVVFNLTVPGEVSANYKVLKTLKLETFLKTICTRKALEYDAYSFEYGDATSPRPAEMDLQFGKLALPLELYLVKKAKVYSSISTNENNEEVIITNIIDGK